MMTDDQKKDLAWFLAISCLAMNVILAILSSAL